MQVPGVRFVPLETARILESRPNVTRIGQLCVLLLVVSPACHSPAAPEMLEPWETTGWTEARSARQAEAVERASRDARALGLRPVEVQFELWSPRDHPDAVGWVHWPEVEAGLNWIHLRADYFEQCAEIELSMRVAHEVCHLKWGPDESLAEACARDIQE
jgi:hypothetical protein